MGEKIENINFLAPTGFRVIISREYYPHLQYFAQSISHPAMEVPATEVPYKRMGSIPFLGDKLEFGTVTFDLVMDEDMKAYEEVYDWMKRMVEDEHQTSGRMVSPSGPAPSYCDIRAIILSSQNNKNRELHYKNALPISLGNIEFASTNDGQYITFPITFRFDYFEIN